MPHTRALTTYKKLLDQASTTEELYKAIVNAPFSDEVAAARMFLGIVVLLRVNEGAQTIDRIALSDTRLAKGTVQMSVKRFEDIKIPLDYHDNIIAEAIHTGQPQQTTDWRYMFEPALTAEEARFNQAGGGIAYSAVYPLVGLQPGGALIFSYFQYPDKIGDQQRQFMSEYSRLASEALRHRL